MTYAGFIAPCNAGYGAEVAGALNIAPNLSLIGITHQNTAISCNFNFVAPVSPNGVVNQYRNVALNGTFNMDLTNATFASISFQNGAFNINRTDNNPSAFVILQGGIGTTSISGTVLMNGGVVFGNISVNPGATLYVSNLFNLGGTFQLTGNCTLKTLGILNPTPNYVDGTTDGSGTPVWLTDAASDESFSGIVTKTVY